MQVELVKRLQDALAGITAVEVLLAHQSQWDMGSDGVIDPGDKIQA
jgi:hypothetical protein